MSSLNNELKKQIKSLNTQRQFLHEIKHSAVTPRQLEAIEEACDSLRMASNNLTEALGHGVLNGEDQE
jgi:hypothetical protein